MDEYINKQDVYRAACAGCMYHGDEIGRCFSSEPCEKLVSEFASAYAADVAPVVHGRWDDSGRYAFPGGATAVRCSECGCALTESEYRLNRWNYCPVCGAKMDGGDDNGSK